MLCPHCQTAFHPQNTRITLPMKHKGESSNDFVARWQMIYDFCPNCEEIVIRLLHGRNEWLIYPKEAKRAALSKDIPAEYADLYRQASAVLGYSPMASAALSRRCLQHLLREVAKTKKRDLAEQIEEVLPTLPSYLARMIDSIRVVGNFAAHPIKSTNTGSIIEVEPGEAELLLDTLEMAFDFYLVQPAEADRARDRINEKLKEAGKPLMK